jgi:hypothetical protein
VLRHVAAGNQLANKRREFTSLQVKELLSTNEHQLWAARLQGAEDVPLVKTLVDAGGGRDCIYQFRHLSFQEGLFAMSIIEGETDPAKSWSDKKQAVAFMKEHVNVCRIGGAQLGNVLAPSLVKAGALDLSEAELDDVGAEALAHLLETSTNLVTSLSLTRNKIGQEG